MGGLLCGAMGAITGLSWGLGGGSWRVGGVPATEAYDPLPACGGGGKNCSFFSVSDVEPGVVPVVWWVAEVPAWQPLVGFAVSVYQLGGS